MSTLSVTLNYSLDLCSSKFAAKTVQQYCSESPFFVDILCCYNVLVTRKDLLSNSVVSSCGHYDEFQV